MKPIYKRFTDARVEGAIQQGWLTRAVSLAAEAGFWFRPEDLPTPNTERLAQLEDACKGKTGRELEMAIQARNHFKGDAAVVLANEAHALAAARGREAWAKNDAPTIDSSVEAHQRETRDRWITVRTKQIREERENAQARADVDQATAEWDAQNRKVPKRNGATKERST